eukprot:Skav227155  [mRNA]  locus=scaffold502:43756:45158:+ [translate_table: standard]
MQRNLGTIFHRLKVEDIHRHQHADAGPRKQEDSNAVGPEVLVEKCAENGQNHSVQSVHGQIFAFVNTPRKGSRSIRNRPMAFCAQNAKMTVEQIMVDLP